MTTTTETVNQNANPFQMFVQYKLKDLPPAIVAMMRRSKIGKQALEFAETNNGSFDGFIPASEAAPKTHKVPAGFRYCMDCAREALAKGFTQEEADLAATQTEENFAKAGTKEDGSVRYASYCKRHNNARAAKYAEAVKDKQRIRTIVNDYLPKAEQRLIDLKAELEALKTRYPEFAQAVLEKNNEPVDMEFPETEFSETVV